MPNPSKIHLLSDSKLNVAKAMRHYMGMRLRFRGTVFADTKPPPMTYSGTTEIRQRIVKH